MFYAKTSDYYLEDNGLLWLRWWALVKLDVGAASVSCQTSLMHLVTGKFYFTKNLFSIGDIYY